MVRLDQNGRVIRRIVVSFRFFFFLALFVLLVSFFSFAELPPALLKIQEYNLGLAQSYFLQMTFFMAFLAGMLGILSPCILPFLPAYFAYTFKEKKNITFMTLVFFFGFALVFVLMGVIAGFFGEQTLSAVQGSVLPRIAGAFLLIMGVMIFLGKGFSSIFSFHHRFSQDVVGVFLFGCTFALGWSACLGPFLSGVLAIGALLHNVYYAGLLLFFYALGNLVPLFVMSFFYDSFSFRMKSFNTLLRVFGFEVTLSSFISSILFVLFGLVLVIFGGTSLVNSFDILGTKDFFYSIQRTLLISSWGTYVGALILIVFLSLLGYFLWRGNKSN